MSIRILRNFSLFDCIKGMILCKRFARMQGNFPIGFNPMNQINVSA